MSQHPSLRISGKIRKVRNVMKRYERINVLRDSGRIPEDKVLGLPKTKPVEMCSAPCAELQSLRNSSGGFFLSVAVKNEEHKRP